MRLPREVGNVPGPVAARWLPPRARLWRMVYVVAIVLATVSDLREPASAGEVAARLERALTPAPSGRDVIDAVRNLVLFAGWGVVWVITAARGRGRTIVLHAAATGLALSALVEATQLLSPVRSTSVLDVASNTLGALIGAFGAAGVAHMLRTTRGLPTLAGVRLSLFALCYAGAVLLEALTPLFRQARHPDAWGGPLARFDVALARLDPGSLGALPVLDVLLFLPAGLLAVLALIEIGWRAPRAFAYVGVFGVLASLLAEMARGFAGYVLALGPPVVHAAAIVAGAALAARYAPAAARAARALPRARPLLAGYALIVLLWSARPFVPESSAAVVADKVNIERLTPLQAYRDRFDLHTAADALIPALLFLPAGVLLAARPLRRTGPARGIAPGVAFAIAIEVAQIGIAGRTFDVTDILIPVAALGTGWMLARRAGYAGGGSDAGRATSSFAR